MKLARSKSQATESSITLWKWCRSESCRMRSTATLTATLRSLLFVTLQLCDDAIIFGQDFCHTTIMVSEVISEGPTRSCFLPVDYCWSLSSGPVCLILSNRDTGSDTDLVSTYFCALQSLIRDNALILFSQLLLFRFAPLFCLRRLFFSRSFVLHLAHDSSPIMFTFTMNSQTAIRHSF